MQLPAILELLFNFQTTSKNATYISKTIQNELISACGKVIQKSIIKQVRRASYFSILADETSDVSRKEQLTLLIRFVDPDQLIIREDFLGFVEVHDVSGEGLATSILEQVNVSIFIKSMYSPNDFESIST